MPRLKVIFAWYNLWVGAYWDRKARYLYLMVPMVGVRLNLAQKWKPRNECNAHHDCFKAEQQAGKELRHCRIEDCEDCFGK